MSVQINELQVSEILAKCKAMMPNTAAIIIYGSDSAIVIQPSQFTDEQLDNIASPYDKVELLLPNVALVTRK